MKKLLLLIFLGLTFSARSQIATGVNGLQAFPWRTFSNPNMVGLIFDGSQYRMYGFDKYALLDTTNATGKFGTKYDISLKTSRSQTISINGTTYDLSANRSWNVGDLMSSGSYSNPTWLTSLAWGKIIGAPSIYSFTGTTSQYTRGDGSYATFPTNISSFTNDAGYLTGITSSQISSALGYTPYNGVTNPNGFLTGITSGQVTTALGYTPVTNARTFTINGTTQDLSANRTWNVGDLVSSGSYANPSWLTSLAWSKITGVPTIYSFSGTTSQYTRGDGSYATFPTTVSSFTNDANYVASSSLSSTLSSYATNSALTSGLAAKQNNLTLTTTGSGAATFNQSTGALNIPTPIIPAQYNLTAGTGIGINGTYPNQTITNTAPDQTVTLSAGTGMSVSGSYPSFTLTNTAPYTVTTVNTATRSLNTNFTISSTKQAQVVYTISLSVTNPLLIGTSTAAAYLEYSTNAGSTWISVSDALISSGVAVTVSVAITNTQSQVVSGIIPANALVRIRTTTSGTASLVFVRGQETY